MGTAYVMVCLHISCGPLLLLDESRHHTAGKNDVSACHSDNKRKCMYIKCKHGIMAGPATGYRTPSGADQLWSGIETRW